MATANPSRPPSEQGPEWQTLDALTSLAKVVEELANRPALLARSNWWDVLPGLGEAANPGFQWKETFMAGQVMHLQIPTTNGSLYAYFKIATYPDRLEFTLMLNGSYIVWQRALYFNEGPRA